MAFTYVDTLLTSRDIIRLNLADTKENQGPRPDKSNFSDAEIAYFLSSESGAVSATAKGFETLASEWTSYALSETEGNTAFDAKGTAEMFAKLADKWRAKPDGGTSDASLQAGVIALDFMQKGDG